MNRLGLSHEELKEAYENGIISSDSVLMTHMACADNPDDPMNEMQINKFEKAFDIVERKTKRKKVRNYLRKVRKRRKVSFPKYLVQSSISYITLRSYNVRT